jgi:hypothetical protein
MVLPFPAEGMDHRVEYIEAFEVSEFGSPLNDGTRARLFPFQPIVPPLGDTTFVEDWDDLRDDE